MTTKRLAYEAQMVEKHEPLARHYAKAFHSLWRGRMTLAEARQIARIGVWKAARGFDPSHGFAFSTFAHRCCLHQFLSEKQGNIVAAPRQKADKDLDPDRQQKLHAARRRPAPLFPEHSQHREDYAGRLVTQEEAQQALSLLNKRARLVVKLRFWHGLTFREIGERLGVTHQRVTQLYCRAMKRVRQKMAPE